MVLFGLYLNEVFRIKLVALLNLDICCCLNKYELAAELSKKELETKRAREAITELVANVV